MGNHINPNQKKAVEHNQGPALVIAPPGSGKTFVITERIRYLLEQGVPPEKILVITFTKAAACEMKQRFQRQQNGSKLATNSVCFQTFHSYFLSILIQFFGYLPNTILNTEEQLQYLKQIYINAPEGYHHRIQLTLEGLALFLNQLSQFKKGIPAKENLYFFQEYEGIKKQNKRMDLEDIQEVLFEKIKEEPNLMNQIRKLYSYIIIDEFQDTDKSQMDCLLEITATTNIFCVGDDDQAIYGFRGIKVSSMEYFQTVFPQTIIYYLTQNYRSRKEIIELSKRLICHNQNRYPKVICAVKESKEIPGYTGVYTITLSNQKEEMETVLKRILHLKDAGNQTIACLFRTKFEMIKYQKFFEQSECPGMSKEKNMDFLDPSDYETEKILREFDAYIRLSLNRNDIQSFMRIMNKPQRYIQRKDIKEPFSFYEFVESSQNKPALYREVLQFQKDLDTLQSLTPFLAFQYFIRKINRLEGKKILSNLKHNHSESIIIGSFQDFLKKSKTLEEILVEFESFLTKMNSVIAKENAVSNNHENIQFLTYHGSKGLEFDHVIIPGINQGIVPHKRAKAIEEIEEERRMLYVAMTRAKESLLITCTDGGKENSQKPSGFWEEFYSSSTTSSNSL